MKDYMTTLAYGQRIAGLKESKRKPALYYNVVDELGNILFSHQTYSLCKWWQQQHTLVHKSTIRSIR